MTAARLSSAISQSITVSCLVFTKMNGREMRLGSPLASPTSPTEPDAAPPSASAASLLASPEHAAELALAGGAGLAWLRAISCLKETCHATERSGGGGVGGVRGGEG